MTTARHIRGVYRSAFSLLELMVVVVLLSVIIVGLVVMFNQTQRAFTSSFTQVDVLESGRSTAGIIGREMEQMAPNGISYNSFNFYVSGPQLNYSLPLLVQPLADPNEYFTNVLQNVYFVTRDYQHYSVVGYCVFSYNSGIGSLYRFCNTTPIPNTNLSAMTFVNLQNHGHFTDFINAFNNGYPTNTSSNAFTRLIDGVVDFRIRAFKTDGSLWTNVYSSSVQVTNRTSPVTDYVLATFTSNSVPAYVEVEMGILEDRALSKYNSLTNSGVAPGSASWNYLSNHVGQVHVFRQRIAVRNVIPAPQAFQ